MIEWWASLSGSMQCFIITHGLIALAGLWAVTRPTRTDLWP